MDANPDTQEAILDAATTLFAERGFSGTSLRAITEMAGTNLAAVNYHFGSKEGLIEAVIMRFGGPVNQERLRRLDDLEAAGDPDPEAIIRAFLEPLLDHMGDPGRAEVLVSLAARFYLEPTSAFELLKKRMQPVLERFHAAVCKALPEVDPITLFFRLHLTIGSTLHLFHVRSAGKAMPNDTANLGSIGEDQFLKRSYEELITYTVAGIAAKAPMLEGNR